MARKSKRSILQISAAEKQFLDKLAKSRKVAKREVERAQILLYYREGCSIKSIGDKVGVTRATVYKCIDKALAMGVKDGIKDLPHKPKTAKITLEAKGWVTKLACTKPKELGLAAEVWSRESLANYVRNNAVVAGYSCLKLAAKATVHRILKENRLQPEKIKYYLEKRDPEFDKKMREVLIVYKEVELQSKVATGEDSQIITICLDEKPGVQALATTAPDLPPVAGKYPKIGRDYEYKRHGTASILAGIDLHDGHVFAQVHHRHRSIEFIALLKEIDAYYPAGKQIRIVLDNHSSHISKETRKFLSTKANRFLYVHTPTHGSWLNLAEVLFGKIARTFLRHIRVGSWEELKERILKGVGEFNQAPVVFRWTKFELLD
jgi:transposase